MDREDLNAVVAAGLIDERPSPAVEVFGEDPVHRSKLRLGAGVSAALAMVATAIDDIWTARTGTRQTVRIDLRHAAVAISSMWLVRVDGERAVLRPGGEHLPPTRGQYRTADGRVVYLQDTYRPLEQGALEVLGCEATTEAIREAIGAWQARDLEEAFVREGLTGVIVRTPDEWLAHPSGQALQNAPVVEIEQIGDAPPLPLPVGPRPLSGLRVLEDTRVLAGPVISRTLAEFGADVLQIGAPRHIEEESESALVDTGHGKRRAYVDLATEGGGATARELLRTADVFSQSYRTGSVERLGLGPRAVAALRPGIVYVSVNCFGHRGPWISKRGFDGNIQAASGITQIQYGDRGRDPGNIAMALNDYGTGYWGAYGVLRALQLRAEHGGSYHVRVSLGQTASYFLRLGTPHEADAGSDSDAVIALATEFMERVESPFGSVDRLRPVIQMSSTNPHWEGPPVRPGTHPAEWA